MVETKTTAIGIVSLLLLVSLGFNASNLMEIKATHYCEETKTVQHCYSLSSTFGTCYTGEANTLGKRCSTSWKLIDYNAPIIEIPKEQPEVILGLPTLEKDGWCYPEGKLRNKVKCDEIK